MKSKHKTVIIEVEELINQKRTPMPHHTQQMRHLRIGVLKHGVQCLMTSCTPPSIPQLLMASVGSEEVKNVLNFACT